MRLSQPLVLQPAAWDFGTAPAGPAMTVLGTLIARIAIILRGVALAEMVVQVIIWHSFYGARPWLLWAPAVALAWGGTAMAYLRRRRPSWQLVCADTAVYAGLALSAAPCVPPELRGVAGSWLFILVTSQIVTPIWFAPEALSAPLAFIPGIAFAVGTALAPPTALVTANTRNATVALLFVVVAVHWLVRRMLCARATRADAALDAADRDTREQIVIRSRNIERREQDRLLHDTVLNTLTAIARSGGTAVAVSQCRRDIAMLERALSESVGAAPADGPGTDPLGAIEAVVGDMRAAGLAVELEATGHAGEPGGTVPDQVAAAMAHATRAALANVAAHAGTGQAWVTVSLTPAGAGAGQLLITIRDAGAGFDVGRVDPARLGVRRSIAERVEDWGGSASVESAPGKGTVVCLSWPAARPGSAPPSATQAVGVRAGQEQVP